MVVPVLLLSLLVSGVGGAAGPGNPAPTSTTGPARAVQDVPGPVALCTPSAAEVPELSGLAVRGEEILAVNDGGTSVRVALIGPDCAVRGELTDDLDPRDVEDLAVDARGTAWLADIGDNDAERDTVALIGLREGAAASLHRLTYPDGAHDAEALLLEPEGVPLVVTKSVTGTAGIYSPAMSVTDLPSPGPTPMRQVGTVSITSTDTPGGPLGGLGSVLVTGGAVSPDGTVAALRTYTDAYLYPVVEGDVAAALAGDPVRVPLPGQPQGEAIALTSSGELLSASEQAGGDPVPIQVVTGADALAVSQPLPGQAEPAPEPPTPDPGEDDVANDEGIDRWQAAVLAVLAAGLLVWLVGLLRRRR